MGLNIKNEETNLLVEQLTQLTGESKTTAIKIAVKERLERLKKLSGPEMAQRLVAIGNDCASRLTAATLSLDHGDYLYDERGLPK